MTVLYCLLVLGIVAPWLLFWTVVVVVWFVGGTIAALWGIVEELQERLK